MVVTMPAFETAAKARRILRSVKLDEARPEKPEPAVLEELLQILVTYGHLSQEQSHQLYVFLTTGGATVPPAVPYTDQDTGKIPLYHLLRAAAIARTDRADSDGADSDRAQFDRVSNDEAIVWAIVTIVIIIEEVGDALSDAWHWLTGLFG